MDRASSKTGKDTQRSPVLKTRNQKEKCSDSTFAQVVSQLPLEMTSTGVRMSCLWHLYPAQHISLPTVYLPLATAQGTDPHDPCDTTYTAHLQVLSLTPGPTALSAKLLKSDLFLTPLPFSSTAFSAVKRHSLVLIVACKFPKAINFTFLILCPHLFLF